MRHHTSSQRGAAALIVTLLLFVAMLLGAAFVNRNLVFEQRIAANQLRSTQAFEAAEAGLEWAIAMLNTDRRLGVDCLTSVDPTAGSFRSRYLNFSRATGAFTPVTVPSAGGPLPLQPGCVWTAGGWSCGCPSSGPAGLVAPTGQAVAPAFLLQFLPTARAGLVRIRAIGCTSLTGACVVDAATRADATAQLEATVALTGGLRTPPAAPITTRGAFDADAASLGLHNPDPATGLVVHAGGNVAAGHARISVAAGATLGASIAGRDGSLASLDADGFFARHFGMSKRSWKAQAGVATIRCGADCGDAVRTAIDASAGNAMVSVDGDLVLHGPLTFGTLTRPVLIVASGAVRLDGPVAIHGVVYGATLEWTGAGSGAFMRGAALSEDSYRGDATPELFYDTAVLAALVANTGSFTRVSGSWRDF